MVLILSFITIIVVASVALFISKRGMQLGLVDVPNERSSHVVAVPKGGGVGIGICFLIAALTLQMPWELWSSVSVLALVGFINDVKEIKITHRLLIQFLLSGVVLNRIAAMWTEKNIFLQIVLCVGIMVVIAGTTNFYNFMDGINGMAAITGVVGFGLLSFFSYYKQETGIAYLSIFLAIACLSFLPFNFPKAVVFMGDSGSTVLGFLFATLVFNVGKSVADMLILFSFLFTFYADELSTMIFRVRNGENLLEAHRTHLYQLLTNEFGCSHWQIALLYGMVQLTIGIGVLFLKSYGVVIISIVLCLLFFIFHFINAITRRSIGVIS